MTPNFVASLLRANQAYYELLCERHTFDGGIAFFNAGLPDLAEANQLREILVPNPDDLAKLYDESQAFFADQGSRCHRWAPSLEQPVEPMARFLADRGFTTRPTAIYALESWPEPSGEMAARVLPARPMQPAYKAAFGDVSAETLSAEIDRLDDARFSAFVAMDGSSPIGRASMFECGETIRINEVFVSPEARGRGVGSALLGHMLNDARRLAVRLVCAQVDESQGSYADFLRHCGLARAGQTSEFDAPQP